MVMKLRSIIFTAFLILSGVFFLFTGFQWLVSPETAADALMMPLLDGAALSSQMSDIGGLFLGMGLVVMGAVVTRKGDWLMPISIILACIGIFRLLAFSLHDATLNPQTVVIEIVLSVWFAIASQKLSGEASTNAA
ncbi:MAG: hypothetical protein GY927_04905 [bacterium]|nr:hypothetical protein [bacterium]